MLKNKTLTYISLFSCAGVGCFGFKKAGFECIATNELIERRINVQKFNDKCKFDSGYICDDITTEETKNKIFAEIKKWEKMGNDKVDVLIATPPCQGMSVANHKKAENEIIRNSLVVESVHLVQKINPRFFIFENVAAFMKTGCTAPDGSVKAIGDVIYEELGEKYIIASRILNFKNYGSNSSRTRTVVIGVNREMAEYVSPIELYPAYVEEKSLRSIIGNMPELEWGEICSSDFYHAFRTYPERMRCWIHDLKEGECAFDNQDELKRPHKIVDGKIVPNIQKNGDKYTRQYWDKVAPCIHTRNDQLASQNTVHPKEDRVFSVRELMKIMTIPDEFKWVNFSLEELNALPEKNKKALLKKEEIKIRQSIGEAVPTNVFFQIAENIKNFMEQEHFTTAIINKTIENYKLEDAENLIKFIQNNPLNLGNASLARIAELTNSKRENNAAYYTNKFILNEIFKELPSIEKDVITILEPSVGIGNFLPFIFKKYEETKEVNIDVVDIDANSIEILRELVAKIDVPDNIHINYINADFLLHDFDKKYDIVVGNPPYKKLTKEKKLLAKYKIDASNRDTNNIFSFFIEKAMRIGNAVSLIVPKSLINAPEFDTTRTFMKEKNISRIIDFGEKGFKGVKIETICFILDTQKKPQNTFVESYITNEVKCHQQAYLTDDKFPNRIIYRNEAFDEVAKKMEFNVFKAYRDRIITKAITKNNGKIRVLKSRNIGNNEIVNIPDYDCYIDNIEGLDVAKYLNRANCVLLPNLTYNPRACFLPKGCIADGSVAILTLAKDDDIVTNEDLAFYATDSFTKFYAIARNLGTRSLNIDNNSVFFFGKLKQQRI